MVYLQPDLSLSVHLSDAVICGIFSTIGCKISLGMQLSTDPLQFLSPNGYPPEKRTFRNINVMIHQFQLFSDRHDIITLFFTL